MQAVSAKQISHLSRLNGVWELVVAGDLDAEAAAELRQHFKHVADGTGVVVDLSLVDFVDAAGLGAIVGGFQRVTAAGGGLVLVTASPRVRRTLALSGISTLIPSVDSTEDALLALVQHQGEDPGFSLLG